MIRTATCLAIIGLMISGCGPQLYYYDRSSGLRVDTKPALLTPFQHAKTECQGEVAQARLGGGGRDVFDEAILAEKAMHGCMSKRGYDVRA